MRGSKDHWVQSGHLDNTARDPPISPKFSIKTNEKFKCTEVSIGRSALKQIQYFRRKTAVPSREVNCTIELQYWSCQESSAYIFRSMSSGNGTCSSKHESENVAQADCRFFIGVLGVSEG